MVGNGGEARDLRSFLRRLGPSVWESRIARGSLFVFLGNGGSTAVSAVRSVLLARALGTEAFGLMTYALSLAMFAAQFVDMKTGDNLVRFVGGAVARRQGGRAAAYFKLGIVIDLVAGLVALLAIGWIVIPLAGGHPQSGLLQPLIKVYMWAVPFRLLKSSFNAILVTFRRFHVISTIQLIGRLSELAVILFLLPFGVVALVWGMVAIAASEFAAFAVCATWLFWRETGVLWGSEYLLSWRSLRPFAVYGSLVGSLKSLTTNLDIVVLGALRPASEVGFYTIARSAAAVLAMAAGAVSQVVYPLMNEAWSLKDKPRVRRLIARLVEVNGTLSLLGMGVVLLLADWLVEFFYGPGFNPAATVLRLLVLSIGLQTVTGWMRQIILIAGYPRLDLAAGIVGTGFYVLLLVPFVQWRGAVGLAVLLILDVFVMVAIFSWMVSFRVRLWAQSPASAPDVGESEC